VGEDVARAPCGEGGVEGFVGPAFAPCRAGTRDDEIRQAGEVRLRQGQHPVAFVGKRVLRE
jgi:hypothetical protein